MATVNAEAIRPWTHNAKEKFYSVEASDFGSELITCPVCKKPVKLGPGTGMERQRDGEGDTTSWEGKHDCGTKLVVFND